MKREARIKARFAGSSRLRENSFQTKRIKKDLDRELHERQMIEETLSRHRLWDQTILRTAMDGFCLTDAKGTILEVNPAACSIYGYSQQEMVGKKITEFRIGGPRKSWSHGKRAMKVGYDRTETKHRRKDGHIVELEFSTNFVDIGGEKFFFSFFHNITERKRTERKMKQRERELAVKTRNLREMNTALKVLLKRRDEDLADLGDQVLFNVEELCMPYLQRLQNSGLNESQKTLLEILIANLKEITSPFPTNLSSKYSKFTPTELRVAHLIRTGQPTKTIANLLKVSCGAIDFQRKNIRKKLGITNRKVNLTAHLMSLTK